MLRVLPLFLLCSCVPEYEYGTSQDGGVDAPADVVPDVPVETATQDREAPTSLLTGCVLLLHMEETSWSGAGAVKDSSGQGNNGTATGTATTTSAGKFGRAASLDGSGWIDVTDKPSLHVSDKLTIAAWIYPTALSDGSASPGIFSKRRGFGDNVAFTLFLYTNNQAYVDVQAARFNGNFVFGNNTWYHVAIVYDGALVDPTQRAKLYVNGTLDRAHTADATITPNTENLQIGNLPNGGHTFTGRIDEVAMWTRALSAEEIKKVAEATGPL
jgi:hypothetical protein